MQKQAYAVVNRNGEERMVLTGCYHDNHSRNAFVELLEEESRLVGGKDNFEIASFFYLGFVNVRSDLGTPA